MMSFSVVSFIDALNRRYFRSAGLSQQTLAVDSETTMGYWASESLQGPNPPLVLIHGFGPNSTWQWQNQVGPLSRHFPLVVPDLLFFGGSTTKSDRRSEQFQAESVVRLVDQLGIKEFNVVGTSYGGFVAYHVARTCRGRVLRAVIASSDVLKGQEDDRMLMERVGVDDVVDLMVPGSTGTLRKLIGFTVYKSPRFVPEFVLRDFVQNIYSTNLKEKVELIKAISLGNKNEFQLTPLSQDVLVIWGDHDRIFPLDKAIKIKEDLWSLFGSVLSQLCTTEETTRGGFGTRVGAQSSSSGSLPDHKDQTSSSRRNRSGGRGMKRTR